LIATGIRSPPWRASLAVCREEHAHAGCRVSSKLRRFQNRIVTQQHGPIQWLTHNQPIELGSGDSWIIDRKEAAIGGTGRSSLILI
jgi:hypothetical protein